MAAGTVLAGWNLSRAAVHQAGMDFPLIDTHVHFYNPARPQGVPWPPREDKFLYRAAMPKDYRALPVPVPVTGVVAVEASPWLEDNQWVLELAARYPFIVGFVGNLPLGEKTFAEDLKRFAANKVFRGVRLRDRNLAGILDDDTFARDIKLIVDLDLSLDLAGGMEILPFASQLATKFPGLRIVIDHLGSVVVDGRTPPSEWSRQMRALSRHPNVYCKLSGLVEGTGRGDGSAPRDVEFYRPLLDVMRRLFSPERLMYASDWPVSERFATLATTQSLIENYFQSHGRAEVEKVFSQTARTAYRLA
jgi:L-fuconolactonase